MEKLTIPCYTKIREQANMLPAYTLPDHPRRDYRVNIAFFLTPRNMVVTVQDDHTLRQGLEKMRYYGYTAIPVVTKENVYVGTISEGDFLWSLLQDREEPLRPVQLQETEQLFIRDILQKDRNPPVRISATIEELLTRSMNQNFIPVIDDRDAFIGIITRRNIIQYFYNNSILEYSPLQCVNA